MRLSPGVIRGTRYTYSRRRVVGHGLQRSPREQVRGASHSVPKGDQIFQRGLSETSLASNRDRGNC